MQLAVRGTTGHDRIPQNSRKTQCLKCRTVNSKGAAILLVPPILDVSVHFGAPTIGRHTPSPTIRDAQMITLPLLRRDRARAKGVAGISFAFIAAIVAVATIGGFMFGYDSGVINGTQKGLEAAFDLVGSASASTSARSCSGCAIGAFGAGRLADTIGRRNVMMISAAVLFLVSAFWAGGAPTARRIFIIARIIGGLASARPACSRRSTSPK